MSVPAGMYLMLKPAGPEEYLTSKKYVKSSHLAVSGFLYVRSGALEGSVIPFEIYYPVRQTHPSHVHFQLASLSFDHPLIDP